MPSSTGEAPEDFALGTLASGLSTALLYNSALHIQLTLNPLLVSDLTLPLAIKSPVGLLQYGVQNLLVRPVADTPVSQR